MRVEKISRDIGQGELEPFIERYGEVKRWLRKVESPTTRQRYVKLLMRYCAATGKNPSELIELKKNSRDHDAEDLLDEFVEEAQKANCPNSKIWTTTIAIKSFYKWNYQDLSRGAGKITLTRVRAYRTPDKESLLKFLEGTHIRDKALISVVACTGISLGSIPDMKWSHVWNDLVTKKTDVPHIVLTSAEIKGKGKGKYEGIQQHTFLTPYATRALLTYKEWRERKEKKQLTPEDYLFVAETKPFEKFTISNVNRIFKQRSKDTGIIFSPHDLRRFVQTALETARLQPNWIKKILRHKVSGEESPYSQPKIEALREAYRTALPYLDLSEKPTANQLELRKQTMRDTARLLDWSGEKLDALENILARVKSAKEVDGVIVELNKRGLRNTTAYTRRLRKNGRTCRDGKCQKIVNEAELENMIAKGWHFVATLPSGKILISNEND
jgi:integrase